MIKTHTITVESRGNCHIIDITDDVCRNLAAAAIDNGVAVVFVVGSTAAITTIEFEPGLVNEDIDRALEKIAPADGRYLHEETWHDDNGHAHVRASLVGPSLSVPIVDGQMTLGTWQQIVLIDFDTRTRTRKIICQIVGE